MHFRSLHFYAEIVTKFRRNPPSLVHFSSSVDRIFHRTCSTKLSRPRLTPLPYCKQIRIRRPQHKSGQLYFLKGGGRRFPYPCGLAGFYRTGHAPVASPDCDRIVTPMIPLRLHLSSPERFAEPLNLGPLSIRNSNKASTHRL